MKIGYARTSTVKQLAGLEAQHRDLKSSSVEKVFSEQVSSVAHRDQLEAALDYVREGDVLVVTKLDRLARSVADLVSITKTLEVKKVALSVLELNLNTSTPTGQLMLNLLGSIAQFERELMLTLQLEGIAKAKAAGLYKGRKPTAMAQSDTIRQMRANGKSVAEIMAACNVSRASIFRVLSGCNVTTRLATA